MSRRIIDLSFSIETNMTVFPVSWHPRVEITQMGRLDVEKRETRRMVLGTHTGTHCDAPAHFIPGGGTIDKVELDVFIGPASVVDLSRVGPDYQVSVVDLEKALGSRHPQRVVLRYDWSGHWGTPNYYKGHPYLSQAAAHWLVDRGVRLVAMDTPMPDNPKEGHGNSVDSPIHKILLGNGVILTEYLCNLDQIRKTEIELIVLPLKILNGDGSPARCVAIENS